MMMRIGWWTAALAVWMALPAPARAAGEAAASTDATRPVFGLLGFALMVYAFWQVWRDRRGPC